MLKYMRKKMVGIDRRDKGALYVHGVLDDDIYSLEVDVSLSISDLEILSIDGKWHRWTTPECPRSTQFLQEAVGLRVESGFTQKVHKIVGRKACRHYANILLECCHTAKEAALVIKWEEAKADRPDLTLNDFIKKDVDLGRIEEEILQEKGKILEDDAEVLREKPRTPQPTRVQVKEGAPPADEPLKDTITGGMMIDLHCHTSPASPCSSAPVGELIEEAKRIGLDAICLTDHNYIWQQSEIEDLKQKHGFLVMRGNEITTDQGDILVFGMYRDIKGIIKVSNLRQEILAADAFMIVAHPIRGFLVFGAGQVGLTPEKAMEREVFRLVDAVEVLNGKVTKEENEFALKVARGLGLPITGGSDAHEVEEIGKYATHFPGVIKNEQDLLAALKKGEYSPVHYRRDKGLT